MDSKQTLKEALIAAGDSSQTKHLTAEALNLTRSEIIDMINGDTKEHLTIGTLNSLKSLVLERVSRGETALPFKSMPGIKSASGHLGGGFW